jgi:hypothetical protein
VIDCPDPQRALAFQRVSDYRTPEWPDSVAPQQMHLDVAVRGLAQAKTTVLTRGATALPGGAASFRGFADPAGHPLCLALTDQA